MDEHHMNNQTCKAGNGRAKRIIQQCKHRWSTTVMWLPDLPFSVMLCTACRANEWRCIQGHSAQPNPHACFGFQDHEVTSPAYDWQIIGKQPTFAGFPQLYRKVSGMGQQDHHILLVSSPGPSRSSSQLHSEFWGNRFSSCIMRVIKIVTHFTHQSTGKYRISQWKKNDYLLLFFHQERAAL